MLFQASELVEALQTSSLFAVTSEQAIFAHLHIVHACERTRELVDSLGTFAAMPVFFRPGRKSSVAASTGVNHCGKKVDRYRWLVVDGGKERRSHARPQQLLYT